MQADLDTATETTDQAIIRYMRAGRAKSEPNSITAPYATKTATNCFRPQSQYLLLHDETCRPWAKKIYDTV